jgi:hypothetical protein
LPCSKAERQHKDQQKAYGLAGATLTQQLIAQFGTQALTGLDRMVLVFNEYKNGVILFLLSCKHSLHQ